MVSKVFVTKQFLHGLKALKKNHKIEEIEKLAEIITKLEKGEVTKQSRNHRLNNSPVTDVHISDDIVLLYRYDADMLIIALELNNLVNHKDLKAKSTRKSVKQASSNIEERPADYDVRNENFNENLNEKIDYSALAKEAKAKLKGKYGWISNISDLETARKDAKDNEADIKIIDDLIKKYDDTLTEEAEGSHLSDMVDKVTAIYIYDDARDFEVYNDMDEAVNHELSDDTIIDKEDVADILTKIKNCDAVFVIPKPKNTSFLAQHQLTADEYKNIINQLDISNYVKNTVSTDPKHLGNDLIVFEAENIQIRDEVIDNLIVYIKLDLDESTETTVVAVSFHDTDQLDNRPYHESYDFDDNVPEIDQWGYTEEDIEAAINYCHKNNIDYADMDPYEFEIIAIQANDIDRANPRMNYTEEDFYNDLKDITARHKIGESLNEKLIEPSADCLKAIEMMFDAHGFIVDKRYPYDGMSIHYQIRRLEPKIETEEQWKDALGRYVKPLTQAIAEVEDKYKAPTTWNFGVDKDGMLTAGVDVRDMSVNEALDESVLNEMAYERADAIDRCASLGKQFIGHFDKIYRGEAQDFKHHCAEMQSWFNDVSNIVLKSSKKKIDNNQLIDWFFTKGSSVEYLFKDPEEQDAYNDFMVKVLANRDIDNNIMNALNENKNESLNEDYNEWEEVASKSVMDSDGFMTDYTWYKDNEGNHIFMFGDKDIYEPDYSYSDHDCMSEEEAQEWFDNYRGFEEEDDNYETMADALARRNESLNEAEEPMEGEEITPPVASEEDIINPPEEEEEPVADDEATSELIELVQDEWEAIDGYNDTIEEIADPEIKDVLKDIAAEENNHVGMLQRALSDVSPATAEISNGEIEADDMMSPTDIERVEEAVGSGDGRPYEPDHYYAIYSADGENGPSIDDVYPINMIKAYPAEIDKIIAGYQKDHPHSSFSYEEVTQDEYEAYVDEQMNDFDEYNDPRMYSNDQENEMHYLDSNLNESAKVDVNSAELVAETIADELDLSDDEYEELTNDLMDGRAEKWADRVMNCSDKAQKMFNDLFVESKANPDEDYFDYLDDVGGYADYNQKIADLQEYFGLTEDEAASVIDRYVMKYDESLNESYDDDLGFMMKQLLE